MSNGEMQKYAVISGLGRSGTNWLLELFNLSPETYCRNEPYASNGAALAELEYYRFVNRPMIAELEKSWDQAISSTLGHMGYRDPVIDVQKNYMHRTAYDLGLYRMVRGRKYRKLLSLCDRNLWGEQWPVPGYLCDMGEQRKAFGVVKLTRSPGWTNFILKHRPRVPVFHIVRHPGGYLNSWANRYLSTTTPESSARLKRLTLIDICTTEPEWHELMGDVDVMGIEELHLWFWVYMNKTIYENGRDQSNYHYIVYEDLVTAQYEIIRPLFEKYGLEWSAKIESKIGQIGEKSSGISKAWRDKLSREQIEIAEKFADMGKEFLPAS